MIELSNLTEYQARLHLFVAIEPGAPFWGKHLLVNSALETIEKIFAGFEFEDSPDVNKIKTKLQLQEITKLED